MRMNGLVAPATIRLAKLRGGWVPTGIVDTMEDAATTSGGRCVVARPPETIVRPPFEGVPKDLPPLEPATDTEIPRLAVDELPHGRVLGEVQGRHHRPGRPPLGAVALLRGTDPTRAPRLQQPLPGRPEGGRRSSRRPRLPRRRELLPLPHRRAPASGGARAGPRRRAPRPLVRPGPDALPARVARPGRDHHHPPHRQRPVPPRARRDARRAGLGVGRQGEEPALGRGVPAPATDAAPHATEGAPPALRDPHRGDAQSHRRERAGADPAPDRAGLRGDRSGRRKCDCADGGVSRRRR